MKRQSFNKIHWLEDETNKKKVKYYFVNSEMLTANYFASLYITENFFNIFEDALIFFKGNSGNSQSQGAELTDHKTS